MMDYHVLTKLVLQVLKDKPRTQFRQIIEQVALLADRYDVFPTREECEKRGTQYHYYEQKRLNPLDEENLNQIIWDLIVDRVLTVGLNTANPDLPFVRLTEFGHSVAKQEQPSYYDPEGYGATLESFTPKIDPVIKQYVIEGLNCFRQRLVFAAAVMFGAAAEKAALLLLESIGNAEADRKKKQEVSNLLDRPTLPRIYSYIQSRLDELIKAKIIPHSVHQGSKEHLLSLFEMIRVQRNDAVHPSAGEANETKVFLTIQALPVALETTYRLIEWFSKNSI